MEEKTKRTLIICGLLLLITLITYLEVIQITKNPTIMEIKFSMDNNTLEAIKLMNTTGAI